MQSPPGRKAREEGVGSRQLPLFHFMIYSNEDLEAISSRLLSGLRGVVERGLRVVPTCHALSYTVGEEGPVKVLGRLNKPLDPVRGLEDMERVLREARLFLLSGRAKNVYTEASLVAVDGPRDLLPLGEQMGPHDDYVAIYVAHIRQPPQVVYAPILRQLGREPRLGAFCWMPWVPPRDFPNIIPIELYGTTAGEA